MTYDTQNYGKLVDRLIGQRFERTLATNSIKLRFGTDQDERGTNYIWIDPPWTFYSQSGVVTSSDEYSDSQFREWATLFSPIDEGVFESWDIDSSNTVTFRFRNGYSIEVPAIIQGVEMENWYVQWYAK